MYRQSPSSIRVITSYSIHYTKLYDYQEESLEEEKPANYTEALHWYDEFLASFPSDEQSPGINFQLAA